MVYGEDANSFFSKKNKSFRLKRTKLSESKISKCNMFRAYGTCTSWVQMNSQSFEYIQHMFWLRNKKISFELLRYINVHRI